MIVVTATRFYSARFLCVLFRFVCRRLCRRHSCPSRQRKQRPHPLVGRENATQEASAPQWCNPLHQRPNATQMRSGRCIDNELDNRAHKHARTSLSASINRNWAQCERMRNLRSPATCSRTLHNDDYRIASQRSARNYYSVPTLHLLSLHIGPIVTQ